MWTICVLLTAGTIATLLLMRPPATAQDKEKARRVKWEYKVVPQEKMDGLGDQGWEVIAVTGGQPYVESFQVYPPQGILLPGSPKETTKNTIKFAPTFYHLKRPK
jgi:hypothetical protein